MAESDRIVFDAEQAKKSLLVEGSSTKAVTFAAGSSVAMTTGSRDPSSATRTTVCGAPAEAGVRQYAKVLSLVRATHSTDEAIIFGCAPFVATAATAKT